VRGQAGEGKSVRLLVLERKGGGRACQGGKIRGHAQCGLIGTRGGLGGGKRGGGDVPSRGAWRTQRKNDGPPWGQCVQTSKVSPRDRRGETPACNPKEKTPGGGSRVGSSIRM